MAILIASAVQEICARAIADSVHAIVVFNPIDHSISEIHALPIESSDEEENLHFHSRQRRAAYDPYDVYYYYPSHLNQPDRTEAASSTINRRETPSDSADSKGNSLKYTPVFRYRSTQTKRKKLFVPNLFG